MVFGFGLWSVLAVVESNLNAAADDAASLLTHRCHAMEESMGAGAWAAEAGVADDDDDDDDAAAAADDDSDFAAVGAAAASTALSFRAFPCAHSPPSISATT